MTDDSYSYFGLNNTYNAKMAYYYYSIENVDNVVNQYMNDTVQAFGLNSKTQLYNFFGTMDWMIQEQERSITITSAATTCEWKDRRINRVNWCQLLLL